MQVLWDPNQCCHAGLCVKNLPDVFKVQDGQFLIDTTKAGADEIIGVVNQCPSGALTVNDQSEEAK